MSIPASVRAKLPKAKLFSIKLGGYYWKPYWAKFRGANFIRWQLGRVCVTHRAPWIERSARANHPHLFRSAEEAANG